MARNSLKNVLRLIDDIKEELPVEQSFLNELNKTTELENDKNKRETSQTYKPSSMTCIRNMYYQVVGHPQDSGGSDYALIGICDSGTDIHERTQKTVEKMKENGFDCEYVNVADFVANRGLDYLEIKGQNAGGTETKLYHKKLNMSFLCDGIVKYRGKYYILELKTEAGFKWQSRNGVDPKHYAQGTAYSIALGIPDVIFVYINRDVLTRKAYMFTPTDDMKEELLGKISECDNYVRDHILPAKPSDLPKTACTYCAYYNSCKNNLN